MTVLGVVFTFHLIGLVIWLGAAFLLPIVILPAARSLEGAAPNAFLGALTRRYLPWFVGGGLVVGLTGWIQTEMMIDDLNLTAAYTKHFVILPLIAVSAYIWFYLARKLGKPGADAKLWNQMAVWAWVQAALAVAVLAITGWLTGA